MTQNRHIKENDKLEKLFEAFLEEMDAKEMGTDADFEETPYRAAKYWKEIWHSQEKINEVIDENLAVTFPSEKEQMVVLTNIEAFSVCPHHLVNIHYNISFGYIPDGEELGLSKIARVLVEYARQPLRQELFTTEMIEIFNSRVKNKGVIILVSGSHGCMVARGVKQSSCITTTTDATGDFLEDPKVRDEFYSIVALQRKG